MDKSILANFEEPDPNCLFNYLLDTTAFNRFADHRDWLDIAEKSLELGFHYYKTANQDYELSVVEQRPMTRTVFPIQR